MFYNVQVHSYVEHKCIIKLILIHLFSDTFPKITPGYAMVLFGHDYCWIYRKLFVIL